MLGVRRKSPPHYKSEERVPLLRRTKSHALERDRHENGQKDKVVGVPAVQVRFETLRATGSGDHVRVYEKVDGTTRTLETAQKSDTVLQRGARSCFVDGIGGVDDDVGNECRRRTRGGNGGGGRVIRYVIRSNQ